jgi:hypothetical protein
MRATDLPVEGGLEVAPKETFELLLGLAEPLMHPPQAADVLAGDPADEVAPGVVRVFRRQGAFGEQVVPPLADDPPLLPVRRANQPVPPPHVRLGGRKELVREGLASENFGRIQFQCGSASSHSDFLEGKIPAANGLRSPFEKEQNSSPARQQKGGVPSC